MSYGLVRSGGWHRLGNIERLGWWWSWLGSGSKSTGLIRRHTCNAGSICWSRCSQWNAAWHKITCFVTGKLHSMNSRFFFSFYLLCASHNNVYTISPAPGDDSPLEVFVAEYLSPHRYSLMKIQFCFHFPYHRSSSIESAAPWCHHHAHHLAMLCPAPETPSMPSSPHPVTNMDVNATNCCSCCHFHTYRYVIYIVYTGNVL